MPSKRYDKNRDCRFDDWRRNDEEKGGAKMNLPLYSTDIDGLEFGYTDDGSISLLALIEKKSDKSKWKEKPPSTVIASFKLAQIAGVPFYVNEHNEDRSVWTVYEITDAALSRRMILDQCTLFEYLMFICGIHNYAMPENLQKLVKQVVAITPEGKSIPA